MKRIYRYSIRCPKRATVLAVLLTLAVAPGVLRLTIRTDGHALVPPGAEAIGIDEAIRETFGVRDPIVVLVRSKHADGVFNVHTLKLVKDLTNSFMELDGVRPEDLFSLETEYGDRVKTGTLIAKRFLEPLPESPTELATLRQDLRDIALYTGTLVSYDEKSASILVGVPPARSRIEFYQQIQRIIADLGGIPETVHIIGAPVAEALLGTHILEDLGVPSAVLGHRMGSTGAPDAGHDSGGWKLPDSWFELKLAVARHIGLVPVAIGIMALVFVLWFRGFTAATLPLAEVGACLVFVFGLMGLCGVPVYLTIAVLPVILTAIGVADEIHIFSRYVQQLRDRPQDDHVAVVTTTMDEMWAPVVKTSVTTAVGFLSFALSPIAPVQAFGIFTAVGIMFCMMWSLTVVPAMLTMFSPRRFVSRKRLQTEGNRASGTGAFAGWAAGMIRLRWAVVVLAVVIVAAAPSGVSRIQIQDSWIDGFAPESEFYQATSLFNEQFLGTHLLLVRVDFGHQVYSAEVHAGDVDIHEISLPGDLTDEPESLVGSTIELAVTVESRPIGSDHRVDAFRRRSSSRITAAERVGDRLVVHLRCTDGALGMRMRLKPNERVVVTITSHRALNPIYLKRIGELERFIEGHPQYTVGGVHGPATYVATTSFMTKARREEERRVPDDPRRIKWLWAQHKRIRGVDRHRQAVDDDYAQCLMTVFLKDANFQSVGRLMEEIRTFERENLTEHGITLEFGGDVAVSQTLIDAIVSTQVRSLLASLVGIFLVTALMGRSVVWGLLSVLPCAVAVLINFAAMGWTKMPLGVATSMFAGMTLGIGVDYAIHLIERYRHGIVAGLSVDEAVGDAVAVAGPAILVDAIAVALGFGVMTLSQVPANARLGGLVILSIIGCLATTLFLLPAILRIVKPLGGRQRT